MRFELPDRPEDSLSTSASGVHLVSVSKITLSVAAPPRVPLYAIQERLGGLLAPFSYLTLDSTDLLPFPPDESKASSSCPAGRRHHSVATGILGEIQRRIGGFHQSGRRIAVRRIVCDP